MSYEFKDIVGLPPSNSLFQDDFFIEGQVPGESYTKRFSGAQLRGIEKQERLEYDNLLRTRVGLNSNYSLPNLSVTNYLAPTVNVFHGMIILDTVLKNLQDQVNDIPTDGAVWGQISGTIEDQEDLIELVNTREPSITPGTSTQFWAGDKSFKQVTYEMLGGTFPHPTGFSNQPSIALSGANVISQITVNNQGHVTGVTSRALTLNDMGLDTSNYATLNTPQTFTAAKVFANITPISLQYASDSGSQLYTSLGFSLPNQSITGGSRRTGTIIVPSLAASYTWTLPTKTGTFAMLSDITTPDLSGYVTLATSQTITGNKIFQNNAGVYIQNGAVIQILPTGASGSGLINNESLTDVRTWTLPNKSGTFAMLLDIPSAPDLSGYVTKYLDETITGLKTFTNNDGLLIKNPASTVKTLKLGVTIGTSEYVGELRYDTIEANRVWLLPDKSGTILVDGDLSAYVPKAGTTTITGSKYFINNDGTWFSSADGSGQFFTGNPLKIKGNTATSPYIGFQGTITSQNLEADRTWYLPNKDGILAIVGDIPADRFYTYTRGSGPYATLEYNRADKGMVLSALSTSQTNVGISSLLYLLSYGQDQGNAIYVDHNNYGIFSVSWAGGTVVRPKLTLIPAYVGQDSFFDIFSSNQTHNVQLRVSEVTGDPVTTQYYLPKDGTSGQILSTNGGGVLSWITPTEGSTVPVFSVGVNGLVPGPASAANNIFLASNGTWQTVNAGITTSLQLGDSGTARTGVIKLVADSYMYLTESYVGGETTFTIQHGATSSASSITVSGIERISAISIDDRGHVTALTKNNFPVFSSTSAGLVPSTGLPSGRFLRDDGSWEVPPGGSGTLTSVGLTMPTGFSVSNSPLTANGSLSVSFAANYSLPLTTDTAKGVTAWGWGNHALAGYLTSYTENNPYGVQSIQVTGTTTKQLSVTLRNLTVLTTTWTDLVGEPGGGDGYVSSVSFNNTSGNLTFTGVGNAFGGDVNLDGRYLQSYTETDPVFAAWQSASVGNSKYYGTNSSGVKGWYDFVPGTGGDGYISNVVFNIATGELAFTGTGAAFSSTFSLDGRYLLTESDPIFMGWLGSSVGNSLYYGTNSSGVKGWYPTSGIGGYFNLTLGTSGFQVSNGSSVQVSAGTGIAITYQLTSGVHKGTISLNAALGNLSNVSLAGELDTQVLRYNGSQWVNSQDLALSWGDHATMGYLTNLTVDGGINLSGTSTSPTIKIVSLDQAGVGKIKVEGDKIGVFLGTTNLTAAAGDHTHDKLHDRRHSISDPNDHYGPNSSVFYTTNTGVVTALALGTANQVQISNGTALAFKNFETFDVFSYSKAGLVPQPTSLVVGATEVRYLCANGTWSIPTGSGTGMANPMTATGDMIYRSSTLSATRLPIGTTGEVLSVSSSGTPEWRTLDSTFVMNITGHIIAGTNQVSTLQPVAITSQDPIASWDGAELFLLSKSNVLKNVTAANLRKYIQPFNALGQFLYGNNDGTFSILSPNTGSIKALTQSSSTPTWTDYTFKALSDTPSYTLDNAHNLFKVNASGTALEAIAIISDNTSGLRYSSGLISKLEYESSPKMGGFLDGQGVYSIKNVAHTKPALAGTPAVPSFDLGDTTYRWRTGYINSLYTNGNIYLGGGTTYYAGTINGDAKYRYMEATEIRSTMIKLGTNKFAIRYNGGNLEFMFNNSVVAEMTTNGNMIFMKS